MVIVEVVAMSMYAVTYAIAIVFVVAGVAVIGFFGKIFWDHYKGGFLTRRKK